MYAIVLWDVDSTFSVITLKSIQEPRKPLNDYTVGETIIAPFGGKHLQCKIYEIGEKRAELNDKLNKGFQLDLEVLGVEASTRKQEGKENCTSSLEVGQSKSVKKTASKKGHKASPDSGTKPKKRKTCASTGDEQMAILRKRRPFQSLTTSANSTDLSVSEGLAAISSFNSEVTSLSVSSTPIMSNPHSSSLVNHSSCTPAPSTLTSQSVSLPLHFTGTQQTQPAFSSDPFSNQALPNPVASNQYVPSANLTLLQSMSSTSTPWTSDHAQTPSPKSVTVPTSHPSFSGESSSCYIEAISDAFSTMYDRPESSQDLPSGSDKSCHECCKQMKALQQKVHQLQTQLEEIKSKEGVGVVSHSPPVASSPVPKILTSPVVAASEVIQSDTDNYRTLYDQYRAAVGVERKPSKVVQKAMLAAFSHEQLMTNTVKGFHTVKTKEARPGLPTPKRNVVIDLIGARCNLTNEEVTKKIRTFLRTYVNMHT